VQIKLIRESKQWQSAYKLHQSSHTKAEAKKKFKLAREYYNFSEYSLHKYAAITAKACSIGVHLDSFTIQKVATRAFRHKCAKGLVQCLFGTICKRRQS